MKRHITDAFLLIEALISIVIASSAIVVLLRGMAGVLKAANASEGYLKAVLLAEGKMAMLEKERGLKIGTTNGSFTKEEDPDGIFSWEQDIIAINTPEWDTLNLPLNEAVVTVKWKKRGVSLVTYVPKLEEK